MLQEGLHMGLPANKAIAEEFCGLLNQFTLICTMVMIMVIITYYYCRGIFLLYLLKIIQNYSSPNIVLLCPGDRSQVKPELSLRILI